MGTLMPAIVTFHITISTHVSLYRSFLFFRSLTCKLYQTAFRAFRAFNLRKAAFPQAAKANRRSKLRGFRRQFQSCSLKSPGECRHSREHRTRRRLISSEGGGWRYKTPPIIETPAMSLRRYALVTGRAFKCEWRWRMALQALPVIGYTQAIFL